MSSRIAFGGLADGKKGVRVAKLGFDANATPPDPMKLIFDSAWPACLPVHQVGTFSAGRGSQQSVSFPQLSFTPLFTVLAKGPGGTDGNLDGNWRYRPGCYNEKAYNDQGQFNSYLRVWVTPNSINMLHEAGTNTSNWPTTIQLAYVIFKQGVLTP